MIRFTILGVMCLLLGPIVARAADPLASTPAAPPGARGLVTIESKSLTLDLQGLTPGEYEVTGLSSAGERFLLGYVVILDPEAIPESISGSSRKEDSVTPQVQVVSCRVQIQLPAEISSADLKQVMLQDLAGTILLRHSY